MQPAKYSLGIALQVSSFSNESRAKSICVDFVPYLHVWIINYTLARLLFYPEAKLSLLTAGLLPVTFARTFSLEATSEQPTGIKSFSPEGKICAIAIPDLCFLRPVPVGAGEYPVKFPGEPAH